MYTPSREISPSQEMLVFVTIESLSSLQHVGDITITRNPILDSIAGLRNLRSVGDIYIRGDGIISIESVGQYIDVDEERTYDVVIPDNACINNDVVGAELFRQQLGVDVQNISSWDDTRCTECSPPCQENSVCDYNGHGMCICPNSNQVGPNCGSMGTIQFDTRSSDLVYDAIEPPIGYTRVETVEIPIRRNTSLTTSPMLVEFRSTQSIWTVLISLWIRSSASTDGTIHTTIQITQGIHAGWSSHNSYSNLKRRRVS